MPWRAIVLVGPAGCGKSTLGERLARHLDWVFVEGDDLHPPGNREKMARGIALQDADRFPWMEAIRQKLVAALNGAPPVVASCSALKRRYREVLRRPGEAILFIWPEVSAGELARRLANRKGHFFSPSLLANQLATFEPGDDLVAFPAGEGSPEDLLRRLLAAIGAPGL